MDSGDEGHLDARNSFGLDPIAAPIPMPMSLHGGFGHSTGVGVSSPMLGSQDRMALSSQESSGGNIFSPSHTFSLPGRNGMSSGFSGGGGGGGGQMMTIFDSIIHDDEPSPRESEPGPSELGVTAVSNPSQHKSPAASPISSGPSFPPLVSKQPSKSAPTKKSAKAAAQKGGTGVKKGVPRVATPKSTSPKPFTDLPLAVGKASSVEEKSNTKKSKGEGKKGPGKKTPMTGAVGGANSTKKPIMKVNRKVKGAKAVVSRTVSLPGKTKQSPNNTSGSKTVKSPKIQGGRGSVGSPGRSLGGKRGPASGRVTPKIADEDPEERLKRRKRLHQAYRTDLVRSFRPNFATPFGSLRDIWKRLSAYHVVEMGPGADKAAGEAFDKRAAVLNRQVDTMEKRLAEAMQRSVRALGGSEDYLTLFLCMKEEVPSLPEDREVKSLPLEGDDGEDDEDDDDTDDSDDEDEESGSRNLGEYKDAEAASPKAESATGLQGVQKAQHLEEARLPTGNREETKNSELVPPLSSIAETQVDSSKERAQEEDDEEEWPFGPGEQLDTMELEQDEEEGEEKEETTVPVNQVSNEGPSAVESEEKRLEEIEAAHRDSTSSQQRLSVRAIMEYMSPPGSPDEQPQEQEESKHQEEEQKESLSGSPQSTSNSEEHPSVPPMVTTPENASDGGGRFEGEKDGEAKEDLVNMTSPQKPENSPKRDSPRRSRSGSTSPPRLPASPSPHIATEEKREQLSMAFSPSKSSANSSSPLRHRERTGSPSHEEHKEREGEEVGKEGERPWSGSSPMSKSPSRGPSSPSRSPQRQEARSTSPNASESRFSPATSPRRHRAGSSSSPRNSASYEEVMQERGEDIAVPGSEAADMEESGRESLERKENSAQPRRSTDDFSSTPSAPSMQSTQEPAATEVRPEAEEDERMVDLPSAESQGSPQGSPVSSGGRRRMQQILWSSSSPTRSPSRGNDEGTVLPVSSINSSGEATSPPAAAATDRASSD